MVPFNENMVEAKYFIKKSRMGGGSYFPKKGILSGFGYLWQTIHYLTYQILDDREISNLSNRGCVRCHIHIDSTVGVVCIK